MSRVTWRLKAEHIRDALILYFERYYPEVEPMSVNFEMKKVDILGKGELTADVEVETKPTDVIETTGDEHG